MKLLIILFIMLLNSCSITPNPNQDKNSDTNPTDNLTLAEKEKLYPYFKVIFTGFTIDAMPSDSDHKKRITINEKKYIFKLLDEIKFLINTPEYVNLLLTHNKTPVTFTPRTGVISGITMKYKEEFDKNKMLNSIRNGQYNLTIQKKTSSTTASTTVGVTRQIAGSAFPQILNSYLDPLNEIKSGKGVITIANNAVWSESVLLPTTRVLQHEISHNLGYTHDTDIPFTDLYNASEYFDEVFNMIWKNHNFQNKYASQIKAFRGYHEEKYKEFLQSDTVKTF